MVLKYFIYSITGGLLFGILDGIINANPLARKLLEFYKPIARTSLNIPAGIIIDLVYGFVMAGVFIILYKSLPGSSAIIKGISYGFMMWFFRVIMFSISQWMMLKVPTGAMVYIILTGLFEMLLLGIFFGLTLKVTI